jgi:hypothetical protein
MGASAWTAHVSGRPRRLAGWPTLACDDARRVAHRKDEGLRVETVGAGEPVLFIHGALIADAFRPLLAEASLSGYRLVHPHRRGYGGSERVTGPVGIERPVRDCLAGPRAARHRPCARGRPLVRRRRRPPAGHGRTGGGLYAGAPGAGPDGRTHDGPERSRPGSNGIGRSARRRPSMRSSRRGGRATLTRSRSASPGAFWQAVRRRWHRLRERDPRVAGVGLRRE